MAKVTCAISGIRFSCDYLDCLNITNEAGFMHPIFAAEHNTLHLLYSKHCKGKLNTRDSYLLFMAFLHSSEQIEWRQPANIDPHSLSGRQLVENNITQLVSALEQTAYIRHPSFSQPAFIVTENSADLRQIPNWIKSWQENVLDFYTCKASEREQQTLQKIENKLSYLILSGESPERFAHVIAKWADKTAGFPTDKAELWKKTIQSCFSINKMFNTPLVLLKEIKDYCECNIDVGSIHFHSLSGVLKEGIRRHVDYLGGSSLALSYTLLDPITTTLEGKARREEERKGDAELQVILAKAPSIYPKKEDYTSNLDFIKAKLAYRVASISVAQTITVVSPADTPPPATQQGQDKKEKDNDN